MGLTENIGRAFARTKDLCRAKSPEILLGLGVAGVVGGVGLTIWGTLRARRHHEELVDRECIICDNMIDGDEDSEDEAGREMIRERILFAAKVAVDYAPAVAATGAGLACIIASHNVQARRIAALTTGYNVLLATFNEYRQKVREKDEKLDSEVMTDILDTRRKVVEGRDKDGLEVGEEEAMKVLGLDPSQDCSSILFDENTSYQFDRHYGPHNVDFLRKIEAWACNKLQADGYLLKSDVLRMLGIPPEEYPMSFITGWVYDHTPGSDVVDFGLWLGGNEANWGDRHPNGWWLTFNDHGVILRDLELFRKGLDPARLAA